MNQKKLNSAQEHPDQIQNILHQEIQLGRMDGPYAVRPFFYICAHLLLVSFLRRLVVGDSLHTFLLLEVTVLTIL